MQALSSAVVSSWGWASAAFSLLPGDEQSLGVSLWPLLGLEPASPFLPQGWLLAWIPRATGTLTSAGFPFMISWSGALQAPLLSSSW